MQQQPSLSRKGEKPNAEAGVKKKEHKTVFGKYRTIYIMKLVCKLLTARHEELSALLLAFGFSYY